MVPELEAVHCTGMMVDKFREQILINLSSAITYISESREMTPPPPPLQVSLQVDLNRAIDTVPVDFM